VKPMTHEQAIGALAAERYLLEEMTETERDDFEAHYFSCAACADDVRLGAVLREGVRSTPSERSAAAGRVVSVHGAAMGGRCHARRRGRISIARRAPVGQTGIGNPGPVSHHVAPGQPGPGTRTHNRPGDEPDHPRDRCRLSCKRGPVVRHPGPQWTPGGIGARACAIIRKPVIVARACSGGSRAWRVPAVGEGLGEQRACGRVLVQDRGAVGHGAGG
jgi:hypothetical protein